MGRWARALVAVLSSAAAHAALVGFAVVIGALRFGAGEVARQQVTIQVREQAKPKPPPKSEPKPSEEKAPVQKVAVARSVPKVEQPQPTPKDATPAAPLRVVGISMEATVEGGGGPTFAVGDTKLGETADFASTPQKTVAKADAPVVSSRPAAAAATQNRVASRIPTAKVEYTLPKRRRPRVPPFPPELRSQGIEADVTVMVTLDETGKVTAVKLITPSPYPAFNQAAQAAAQAEEFEPARRDGVAVPYTLSYTYRFRIEDR